MFRKLANEGNGWKRELFLPVVRKALTKVLGQIRLREKKRRKHSGQGKNISAKCWGSVLFKNIKVMTDKH